MSKLYLVRHGQAGTRDSYDCLSERGRRQSRLLGEYFAAQDIRFAAAYSGQLARQQATAAEVQQAYEHAGKAFPPVVVDPGWNEFDLDWLYHDLAPMLAREDSQFRQEFAAMQDEIHRQAAVTDAPIHRQWMPCDTGLVEAWIAGRFPCKGETWNDFCRRVARCRERIAGFDSEANLVVFTSAVPVSIWAGMSLEISDRRIMRLAAVLYNTAVTIVRMDAAELRLYAFNLISHLNAPELRTHR